MSTKIKHDWTCPECFHRNKFSIQYDDAESITINEEYCNSEDGGCGKGFFIKAKLIPMTKVYLIVKG